MTPVVLFWYGAVVSFLVGSSIGSFLNVVIYRLPLDMSLASPPSRCGVCETPIRFYDNIPILSWFLLRGKCRTCKASYSFRYPAVELFVGLVAIGLWWKHASPLLDGHQFPIWPVVALVALRFAFFVLLIAITAIDLEHLIIPHELTFPGMALGLASPWILKALFGPHYQRIWPPVSPGVSILGWLVGGLFIILVIQLYFSVRKIQGMGGGDVTLMAMLGAWLGWPALIFILFAASMQGLIAAGIAYLIKPNFLRNIDEVFADEEDQDDAIRKDSESIDGEEEDGGFGMAAIPFGPFLALAGAEFMLFGHLLPQDINMLLLYL